MARVLDPLVERLSKQKEAAPAEEEEELAALHAPSWGRSGGGSGPSSPVPLSSSSSSARPQDSFVPRVNNDRNAVFVPPRRGWAACCRVADGGGAAGGERVLGDDDGELEEANAAASASASASASAAAQCTYHPLERFLASLETCTQPWQLEQRQGSQATKAALSRPPPLSATPFTFVDTPSALSDLVRRWLDQGIKELAFDLEAHSFHSFQGFTCLIQLSTRTEDAVVDALRLRSCAGKLLAPLFADPRVAKVAHGARHDVSWLQRDFGLFVCNLFDTGVAAGLVGRPRGLGALYEQILGIAADKKWQTADWRTRPLPRAALAYAREDTHWLLHVADILKAELLSKSDGKDKNSLLKTALEASRQLCLSRYEPERFSRKRALAVAATVGGGMRTPGPAREVFVSLADWRDAKARLLDDSTGAVLPKGMMAKISKVAANNNAGGRSPQSFDAGSLRSAVGGGGGPCMVSRYNKEVVEAVREGLRRWERLRSGELSEASLLEEGGGGDEDEEEERDARDGGGGGNGNGGERGKGFPPTSLLAPAPKPMLLDPSSMTNNNAVPFSRRGEGCGSNATAAAVVLLPAAGASSLAAALGGGNGGNREKVKPSLSASAVAFAPSPMASSFFGSGVPAQKQNPAPPPQLSFSMPLAFAPPTKAPSPPPAATSTSTTTATAAVDAPKSRSKADDFLPVPLGDLRPGSQRAQKGRNQQRQEEEEEERKNQKKNKGHSGSGAGAFGDGDTEADAAVASILKAGRKAMDISSSSSSSESGSGSESSDDDDESDSGSDSAPEEVAAAAAAAAALPRNNSAAAAAANSLPAAPRHARKRPSPASFDFEAKIVASPGIVSAAEPPQPADGGRGRGGDRGAASSRGGRGRGRLGSNRDLMPAGPAPPTASFDPYALNRLGEIKGGKRSGTMPRSGNKSKSFV